MTSKKVADQHLDDLIKIWKDQNSLSQSKINMIQNQILNRGNPIDHNWWLRFFKQISLKTNNKFNLALPKMIYNKSFFHYQYESN